MTNRAIPCPQCKGNGWFMRECWNTGGMKVREDCGPCKGSGTIPDRRTPTASDRAVERIKEVVSRFDTLSVGWAKIIDDIIREEEGK